MLEDTQLWGAILKFILEQRLHPITRSKWNEKKYSLKNSTFEDLIEFLKSRANNLQAEEIMGDHGKTPYERAVKGSKNVRTLLTANVSNCNYCEGKDHYISSCPQFIKMSVNERFENVKQKRLCINCLKTGHMVRTCPSTNCRICGARHHTMIHIEKQDNIANAAQAGTSQGVNENVTLTSHNAAETNQVLLSTVLVKVKDRWNNIHTARALLDVGSQSSFITCAFVETLKLQQTPTHLTICGLNGTHSEIKQKCSLEISSRTSDFTLKLDCLVVPKITGLLPNIKINKDNLAIPPQIKLADPKFHCPGKIDILIGADRFYELLCIGQIKLAAAGPILQQTRFGWVVGGSLGVTKNDSVRCHLSTNERLERQVARFWEIEEFPDTTPLSPEEDAVERHFIESTSRNDTGRFIVQIPLKLSPEVLGDSKETAIKRFINLEAKLMRNPDFSEMYHRFIAEYIELGHMIKVEKTDNTNRPHYYMPHHGILKRTEESTKIRVVFDSSCTTSSGYSFNDIQMIGPTIQSDLFSILLRYRKHKYAVAADIEKMYRMCLVTPSQRPLQRIVWRDHPNQTLDTYELTTVTYGTSAAPFLAIRCLYQLGIECKEPAIAEIIKTDFYVDDLLTGASTIAEATHIAERVTRVLAGGGFRLCKFKSNSSLVLNNLRLHNEEGMVDLGVNENAQTLGLIWNAQDDSFLYRIRTKFSDKVSKRIVLSESSQIFDPLGLLSATTIVAKMILRDLWLEKIGWDDALPLNIHSRWLEFRNELIYLSKLKIPRIIICDNPRRLEIHAFSDASSKALGACVYLKSTGQTDLCTVRLICAKSKVCPVKTQTIPRLELTAALLSCRLVAKVLSALKLEIDKVYYWTDSSVVLGWIRTPPHMLEVFVANRVSSIQNLSEHQTWRHVPTQNNPADIISRGTRPRELESIQLYWNGPPWLHNNETSWPSIVAHQDILPDMKKIVCSLQTTECDFGIFERFSSLTRLERIICYAVMFWKNLQRAKNGFDKVSGPLTSEEITGASNRLARLAQMQYFAKEIRLMSKGQALESSSNLTKLNPFLDPNGIIRVGGRLEYSNFPYNKRHPILLSDKGRYTRMLFEREHKRLLHAGPEHLLAHVRNQFWVLRGRNIARKTVHECITCFRQRPTNSIPLMGNLPSSRLKPSPPFYISGVDYAGPFKVKDRQGRGCKVTKAYICLFVCFVTRAIHIELASDLTKECFIAAFRRFASRRGKPSQLYSDNGTNFVGAHSELERIQSFFSRNKHHLKEAIENEGVSWSFIPPHAPHFGGLWEAGVKSAKYHLLRIAGNAILTFEQLYTLLVQIEGILNSRPMHPLSSDPSDLQPLTPAHFLIGRALVALPDENLLTFAENRLKLYQRIQQLLQHFWSRWYHQYIAELQPRVKWMTNQQSLKTHDLVLIKEDNLPPLKWALGRIVDLHPGKDGIARVATLRTQSGLLKRPIIKLCRLPNQNGLEELSRSSPKGGGC